MLKKGLKSTLGFKKYMYIWWKNTFKGLAFKKLLCAAASKWATMVFFYEDILLWKRLFTVFKYTYWNYLQAILDESFTLLEIIYKSYRTRLSTLGAIFILRKDIGVGGWPRKWQFSLTLCSEMSLRRWVGGSKKPQNTLT